MVRLRVIGYGTVGHKEYIRLIQNYADELRIGNKLEVVGCLPRKELLDWCRKCDVGIALVPKRTADINEQHMTGASNKSFDYLACGLALLVSDLPDWTKMYVETGYGLACNPENPESIAAALRWFLEHPVEMRQMGEQGRRRILSEWNYEKQFMPVFDQLQNRTLCGTIPHKVQNDYPIP